MVMMMMQADRHQEKLDLAKAKKLDADGLVNFITINEVRYITEYSQVVGLPPAPALFCSPLLNCSCCKYHCRSGVATQATFVVTVSLISVVNWILWSGVSLETAVGLFNSEVKTHLVLFANRGTKTFTELKDQLEALAPEFTGKVR